MYIGLTVEVRATFLMCTTEHALDNNDTNHYLTEAWYDMTK